MALHYIILESFMVYKIDIEFVESERFSIILSII